MPELRREERFAFDVVRRALGTDVAQHDDGSAHEWSTDTSCCPVGGPGAVEVTTVGDPAAMQLESIYRTQFVVDGITWSWTVNLGSLIRINELRQHLPNLVRLCEELGVRDPDYLEPIEPCVAWYQASDDIEALGGPETSKPGSIYLIPGMARGGMVPEHLDGLPAWLEVELRTRRFASDLAKLAASGRTERHLFLRVHDTWLPWELDYLLSGGSVVPNTSFDPPTELTALWLATRWQNPILWWSRAGGWQRVDISESKAWTSEGRHRRCETEHFAVDPGIAGTCVGWHYVAAMLSVVIASVVSLVIGSVGGSILEASKGWVGRYVGAKKDEHVRLRDGDHLAINTGLSIGLDSGSSSSFRVGVDVAPSVSFDSAVVLDPTVVAAWVERVVPGLTVYREYQVPDDLIRFIDGQTILAINAKGLISLLVPITHHTAGEGMATKFTLDLSSVVSAVAPFVTAIVDGGFASIYPGRLLSQRLDWRISASRAINADAGSVPWSGLVFAGRPPKQSTPGQLPPSAGEYGFGGAQMRNLAIDTTPTAIVMMALRSFIERSGHSGLDDCLADLRAEVDDAVTKQRTK